MSLCRGLLSSTSLFATERHTLWRFIKSYTFVYLKCLCEWAFLFLHKIVHTDVYTCVCEGKRSSRANCHFYKIYLFRYWLATCVCLWVCVSYVFSYAGQKKLLVHLELEVKMVVSCHMVSWSFTVATSAFYHWVISIAALIYF